MRSSRGRRAAPVRAAQRSDTVILFSPPSSFTICHHGREEPDVVTGRRVYLELVPVPGAAMFRFRVHGQEVEPKLTGLSVLRKDTSALATALDELSHSSQHIAAISLGAEGSPLAAARARYLGVVTPTFSDALVRSRGSISSLADAARVVHHWCGELHPTDFPGAATELRDACTASDAPEDVAKAVSRFESSAAELDAARDTARESLLRAAAQFDDAAASADAIKMLDLARGTADAVVSSARPLARNASALSRAIATLRVAIASLGALRPSVPTFLATYSEAGNVLLRIDAVPAGIEEVARTADENEVSFRFPVIGRHYFDVEVGAGVTGGLPQIPSIGTFGGSTTIQGRDVDQFVALALVELEPFRFGWPDKPLAGLIRLPVIGIPLSRDPTQNFFVGGGIGWTGLGSITAGPYFLRELTLLPGHAVGDAVFSNTSLNAIASPQVRVGFFVSASIDLVGLFHLFFPEHLPSIDAATGRLN